HRPPPAARPPSCPAAGTGGGAGGRGIRRPSRMRTNGRQTRVSTPKPMCRYSSALSAPTSAPAEAISGHSAATTVRSSSTPKSRAMPVQMRARMIGWRLGREVTVRHYPPAMGEIVTRQDEFPTSRSSHDSAPGSFSGGEAHRCELLAPRGHLGGDLSQGRLIPTGLEGAGHEFGQPRHICCAHAPTHDLGSAHADAVLLTGHFGGGQADARGEEAGGLEDPRPRAPAAEGAGEQGELVRIGETGLT